MAIRHLIVIPTYNEIDNIREIVPRILALPHPLEVLVVDDNSPDGTGAEVEAMAAQDSRIHCLHRPDKLGLGSAYIAGFRWALARDYAVVFEMDADFSHDPQAIPEFLAAIDDADVVLGSRYLDGVTVVNWPLKRLILSYTANAYSRLLTGLPVNDATGGFKAFRREVLESIDLSRIRSDGYSFQIEVSFLCWRKGFHIREISIIFADRSVGISKMSRRIITEAIFEVWRLFFIRLFTRRRHRPEPLPLSVVAGAERAVSGGELSGGGDLSGAGRPVPDPTGATAGSTEAAAEESGKGGSRRARAGGSP